MAAFEGASARWGRRIMIGVPYLWLLIFFLIPFAVVLKLSFSSAAIAIPPYAPTWDTWEGVQTFFAELNFDNYTFLFEDSLYVNSYLSSLKIASISTFLTLLVGYPLAYAIARSSDTWRNVLVLLVILPFWTSFLIRVYAWIGILKTEGLLNLALESIGLISAPLQIYNTDWAVYIGIVYTYLPFMILPLYATLSKLDMSLLEASADLGAKPWVAFLTVTLPLSLPGIIAGSMLVFIPAIGEFVIPALLGGPDTLMIGKVLWTEFFSNRDWPVASAVAIAMLIVIVAPIMWLRRIEAARGVGQ